MVEVLSGILVSGFAILTCFAIPLSALMIGDFDTNKTKVKKLKMGWTFNKITRKLEKVN